MRLEVYAAETRPLLDYYQRRGILAQIDGIGTPEEIQHKIISALNCAEAAADR
jgi:adenylate kinase